MTVGTYTAFAARGRGSIERWVGTSAADTDLTTSTAAVTTLGLPVRRLLFVGIQYSATPTYSAGCTITLNSGAGGAYDIVLDTSGANDPAYTYEPITEIFIGPDDAIDVKALAGGGVITSGTIIITERL